MYSRTYPCFCDFCFQEDFAHCNRSEYVGEFKAQYLRKKGLRTPTSRFNEDGRVEEDGEEFVVERVIGGRLYEDRYQYEVEWVGHPESTWIDADRLTSCARLVEEYELDKVRS